MPPAWIMPPHITDDGTLRAEKAVNTDPTELKCLNVLKFIITSEYVANFCPFACFVAVAFGKHGRGRKALLEELQAGNQ